MYLLSVFPLIALFVASWAAATEQIDGWENRVERGWEIFLLACAVLSPAALFLAPSAWFFWLGSVVVLYFFCYVFRNPPAAEREARLLRTALLVCLAIVNLSITVRPFVDRFKSFVPFVQQLRST